MAGGTAMSLDGYRIIAPLTYRGKAGCTNPTCTRFRDRPDPCFGWHCSYCDEACSYQGHTCEASQTMIAAAQQIAKEQA